MASSKAKMHQHVRHHTAGLPCVQYSHGFLTIMELLHHEHLHAEYSVFKCPECEAEYYTQASLKMHIVESTGRDISV